MKKQTKQLLAVVIVLILCLVAFFAVTKYNESQAAKAAAEATGTTLGSFTGDLVSLSFYNGSETLDFTCTDGVWSYSDPAFPVAQSYLTDLSSLMTSLTPDRSMEQSDTLEAYGLADPAYTVTASDADGNTLSLSIGSATTSSSSYYAMVEGSDAVYTISSDLVNAVSGDLYDLIQLESFPTLSEANISGVTLTTASGALTLTKETSTVTEPAETEGGEDTVTDVYTWYIVNADGSRTSVADATLNAAFMAAVPPDGTSESTDTSTAAITGTSLKDDLVTALTSLKVVSCKDYNASSAVLAECGLDSPTLFLTVSYTDGDADSTFSLTVGDSLNDGSNYYAVLDDSSAVNVIDVTLTTPMLNMVNALA